MSDKGKRVDSAYKPSMFKPMAGAVFTLLLNTYRRIGGKMQRNFRH